MQYTFGKFSIEQLVRELRRAQRQIINLENKLNNIGVARHEATWKPAIIYIGKTGAEGIPALEEDSEGDEPGEGEVELFWMVDGRLQATGKMRTAYNLSLSAVAAETYVQLKEELLSRKLFVDFEDCGE